MRIQVEVPSGSVKPINLLPSDLYTVAIAKEPEVLDSKKELESGMTQKHIAIQLVVLSHNSDYVGACFNVFLTLPNSQIPEHMEKVGDMMGGAKEERYIKYARRLWSFYASFCGYPSIDAMPSTDEMEWQVGMLATIPIVLTEKEGQKVNEIPYSALPVPVDHSVIDLYKDAVNALVEMAG